MGAADMATLVDGLVTEANASRDGAINAVDAVDRETRRSTGRLAAQVDRYIAVHESAVAELKRIDADPPSVPAPVVAERDTRFDPEEGWDTPPRPAPLPARPAASEATRDDDSDEDEDYSESWLR